MQIRNAEVFASLHRAGAPLLLANAWDVASAVAIESAGAKAIATTSAGVAWSLGVPDAAGLGARKAAEVIARITAAVSVPVSADIEAGYGDSPDAVAATALAAVQAGAVGVNLEDRRERALLFETAQQADRLAAARAAARDVPVWINARTDVFLGNGDDVDEALQRARAYASAGASGFFVPGLTDDAGIRRIAENSSLPINVMVMNGVSPVSKLAKLGVARVSYGPIPFVEAMGALQKKADKALS